ncbi:MAG TPA: iron-enterobactin ABC transporter permease, partial [Microbacterium sp.]|nr:iron-enterobactin ABC transporter permease [Microbacterium sp.]
MTRTARVSILLVAAIAIVVVLSLGTGSAGLSPLSTIDAAFGRGERVDVMIVQQWRLPRAVAAIVFGAALALAGSLMQNATRNPLGSPDVIGFDTGAFTGALVAGIVLGGAFASVTVGALLGGLLAAFIVFVIARLRGSGAFRLIIVGIAMSAFLASLNTWIILAADVKVAMSASSWALGSLNDVSWTRLVPAAVVIACCALPVVVLIRPLQVLALGDPLARGLGVNPGVVRVLATVLAVLLS